MDALTDAAGGLFLRPSEAGMAESVEAGVIQVGDWRFDPVAGELSRDGQRKRLEDRAARTLELLCRERGQVVSHQTLVDTIGAAARSAPTASPWTWPTCAGRSARTPARRA